MESKVRGVLCRRCNIAISYFDGDVAWLRNAIAYLNFKL